MVKESKQELQREWKKKMPTKMKVSKTDRPDDEERQDKHRIK